MILEEKITKPIFFSRLREEIHDTHSYIEQRKNAPKKGKELCWQKIREFLTLICDDLNISTSRCKSIRDFLRYIPDSYLVSPKFYEVYEQWEKLLDDIAPKGKCKESVDVIDKILVAKESPYDLEVLLVDNTNRWDALDFLKAPDYVKVKELAV